MFTWLILIVGVCASAVSFVFIRESTEPPVMLAAYRVLLAGLLLLPVYFFQRNQHGDGTFGQILQRSVLPGLVLGVHFISWVIGVRLTPAANATIIVNLMPIVMPFLMYFAFSENLHRHELLATVIAIAGVALLAIDDYSISRQHFHGDLICFVSMILFALYLALARHNQSIPSVWLYVVPVYLIAGISTFVVALFFSNPIHVYTPYNALMIFLTAAVSTVIGHSALNYAMQKLRGQTVTIVNMGQFIVAGIVGFLLYQEVPTSTFYVASILLTLAVGIVILKSSRS